MNAVAALELLIQLTLLTQRLATLMQTAHGENREVSDTELDALAGDDDAARALLQAAIAKARES